MNAQRLLCILAVVTFAASTAGCLTRRTVSVRGETVEDGYVIRRPIKEAIQNTNSN